MVIDGIRADKGMVSFAIRWFLVAQAIERMNATPLAPPEDVETMEEVHTEDEEE